MSGAHQQPDLPLDLESIHEHWCSLSPDLTGHRDLPGPMVQQLKTGYLTSTSGMVVRFDTAPGSACTECDLPTGSTWAEVEAVMLDTVINPGKETHLLAVQEFTSAQEVA